MKTKIAVVTGGSRGLGRDMAISLAQKGQHIIITYQSKKAEAQAVVREIENLGQKAEALPLEMAAIHSYPQFVETLSSALREKFQADRIDYLVNNAGMGVHAAFADTTEAQFDSLMNVHLKGVFFLSQRLLPLLCDGGGIVNISTGLARFSFPGYAAYAAMKGGVETLTRYMAKELGGRQIRVNTVAPGAIETDFGGGVVRDNKDVNAQIASVTALGRAGKADDIGSVVAFLCSEEARWVNAQRIEVSGGMML